MRRRKSVQYKPSARGWPERHVSSDRPRNPPRLRDAAAHRTASLASRRHRDASGARPRARSSSPTFTCRAITRRSRRSASTTCSAICARPTARRSSATAAGSRSTPPRAGRSRSPTATCCCSATRTIRCASRCGSATRPTSDLGDRLIASRSIMDLPAVADQIERDPAERAPRLQGAAAARRAARAERGDRGRASTATFELLPRATHVAILLRSESDKDRFALAVSRERAGQRPRAAARRIRCARAAPCCAACSPIAPRCSPPTRRRRCRASRSSAARSCRCSRCRCGAATTSSASSRPTTARSAGMFTERDLEVALLLGAQAVARDRQRDAGPAAARRRGAGARRERLPQAPRGEDQVRQHHRRLAGDEGGARAAREGDRYARHRLHRGRDRHRQGADRERDPLPVAARATRCSSRRTAPRCPRTCSRASCSATSAARSPAPTATRRACSRSPTAARCSSTRWARCR